MLRFSGWQPQRHTAICVIPLLFVCTVDALTLTGVSSRKLHGAGAVAYDLPLAMNQSINGAVTVEPRDIGAGHLIVFQFDEVITSAGSVAVVDEASATVTAPAPSIGTNTQEILVSIPALADNKRVAITLSNINGIGFNVSVALGFRVGDFNNSATLTQADVSSVKARAGQTISVSTFQFDVNKTGAVTAADIAVVKKRSGLFPTNAAPVVNAGTNQTISLPASATLTGSATDDGQPNPPGALSLTWSRVSGPGTVTFGNAAAASTTASFSAPGAYVLRLSANDSQLTNFSDVTITANQTVLPGLFEKPHPWNKDVSAFPVASRSAAIINALVSFGGFGFGRLQTDFSIAVLEANSATPRRTITAAPGYCFSPGSPDCEPVPLQMPIPPNGNVELGGTTYQCPDPGNEDCHIIVIERTEKKLYELYQGHDTGTSIQALGAFIWDLTKQYTDVLRGDQCTSADAAGLPIAALTPTADEVASGEVHHALRFILPNPRMKAGVFVRPATHAGGPSSANANAPPYGVRFRLKASFDETPFSAGARVILRALKKYGMILSDGGNIALTFADDRLSTAKWLNLGITSQTFNNIAPSQFDVVDLGPEIVNTFDCVRAP